MQSGHPGSPPPSSYGPGNNDLGPQVAIQSKRQWTASERDEQGLLSAMRAPNLWRITLHGQNVLFRVAWGTSGQQIVKDVVAPARFSVPGSVEVYAYKYPNQLDQPAHAEVTCTPATSGGCDVMRAFVVQTVPPPDPASIPIPLDPNAARFVALEQCTVDVGPINARIQVTLTALQSVPLTAGSELVAGTGFLEFEP